MNPKHNVIGTWVFPPEASSLIDTTAARLAKLLDLDNTTTPSSVRRRYERAGEGRDYLAPVGNSAHCQLLYGRRDGTGALVAIWRAPAHPPRDPPWNNFDLPREVFGGDVLLREWISRESWPDCESLIDAPWGQLHREGGGFLLDIVEDEPQAIRQLFELGSLIDWWLLRIARGRLPADVQDFLTVARFPDLDPQQVTQYFRTKWHHLSQQLLRWTQLFQQMNASVERSLEMARSREAKRQALLLLAELRAAGVPFDVAPHRVFISSGDIGFREFRTELRAELQRNGYLPISIEDFAAREQDPAQFCQEHVVGCNALVLLLGERYARPWNGTGKSVTHLEWDAAESLVRIAVLFEGKAAPREEIIEETQESLTCFRKEVLKNHSVIRVPPNQTTWQRKAVRSLNELL